MVIGLSEKCDLSHNPMVAGQGLFIQCYLMLTFKLVTIPCSSLVTL